jgi:predicted transcriptional regulator
VSPLERKELRVTDKYIVYNSGTFSYVSDRDDKHFVCSLIHGREEITAQELADLMNSAYKKGGDLAATGSSFELEDLKLQNKHLIEENQFIKKRSNDLERALDYAYRASDILKEMGHRDVRYKYAIPKEDSNKITIEKQTGFFGESFQIKKDDMLHGMFKDVDEKIVREHIEPLVNYFYTEGLKDAGK